MIYSNETVLVNWNWILINSTYIITCRYNIVFLPLTTLNKITCYIFLQFRFGNTRNGELCFINFVDCLFLDCCFLSSWLKFVSKVDKNNFVLIPSMTLLEILTRTFEFKTSSSLTILPSFSKEEISLLERKHFWALFLFLRSLLSLDIAETLQVLIPKFIEVGRLWIWIYFLTILLSWLLFRLFNSFTCWRKIIFRYSSKNVSVNTYIIC